MKKTIIVIALAWISASIIRDTFYKQITKEYQFNIDNDYIYLYDNNRYIGSAPLDTTAFSQMLINDNQ